MNSLVAKSLSEQLAGPVDDAGLPVNAGSEATKPTTFTTRVTWSRSPMRALMAAIALRAQACAISLATSGDTSAPTLPVAAITPSTIGS